MSRKGPLLVAFCLASVAGSRSGASSGLKAPVTYFDIRGSLADRFDGNQITLHSFRTGPDGLYFCVAPGPVARNAVILKTDWNGIKQAVFRPPPDREILDFDVADRGDVYVLVTEAHNSIVMVYGPDGQLQSATRLDHFSRSLCLVDGKPVVFIPDRAAPRLEVLDSQGPKEISLAFRLTWPKPSITSLPGGRIVFADTPSGVIYVMDLASGRTSSFSALPPSITPGPPPSPSHAVLQFSSFSNAATDPEGDVYVIAGRLRMADGAPLSRFNSLGALIESFRCALPTFESMKDQENPEGYMVPYSVGLGGHMLFLVSGQGQVAAYAR
jgi:hypothetical protein